MREFALPIQEPFQKGLRPERTYLNEEGFLEACFNMIPDEGGLRSYEGLEDPFQGGLSVAFPLPQAFLGRDIVLLAGATTVSAVNVNVSPWTISALSPKDPADPDTDKAITAGGVWHFADLGPAWYLTNGESVVFRSGFGTLGGTGVKTFAQDSVPIETLCEHRGRVFIGGLDAAKIWNSTWTTIFSSWESEANLDDIDLTANGPGTNWVMWSSIGGGDFPLWLFYPEEEYSALGLGPGEELILRRLKRNEFGWIPMPWKGTVLVLKPLGDKVVVYGDNGISALVPRGKFIGHQKIARFGVLGRGAVGGDEGQHVFLDQSGVLWSLDANLQLVRLGYQEFLGSLPATSTVISHNPAPEDGVEYYICGPDEGYYLSSLGLAEIPDRVTSLPYLDGSLYAIYTSAASSDVRVQTGAFDNRRQAYKTIHDIQVQYSDLTNIKVAVLYRYDHTSEFQTWGPVGLNPQGVVTPMLTALEFKIRVTGTPGTVPRLDGLEVRWNLVDKRSIRGLGDFNG